MAGTLPGFLLGDAITVEHWSAVGPTFGTASTVRAHVQEARKLVRSPETGVTADATLRVFLRAPSTTGGAALPVGSRLTIRGEQTTAVTVDVNDHPNLPGPSHVEVWCERCAVLPTTTLTVLRGTPTADAFGDLVPSTTEVATGLPAHVIEQDRQTRSRPVDERTGVVETYTIRLASSADIREGDRVRDDTTGRVYLVERVITTPSGVGPAPGWDDVRLLVQRVAGTSTPNT